MPVKITIRRPPRRIGYDQALKRIAANVLPELHANRSIMQNVEALNALCIQSPSGTPWSFGTLRRFIQRAGQLGFAVQLRTPAEAARGRPYVHRLGKPTRRSVRGRSNVDRSELQREPDDIEATRPSAVAFA